MFSSLFYAGKNDSPVQPFKYRSGCLSQGLVSSISFNIKTEKRWKLSLFFEFIPFKDFGRNQNTVSIPNFFLPTVYLIQNVVRARNKIISILLKFNVENAQNIK